MANEITAQMSLTYNNTTLKKSRPIQKTFNVNSVGNFSNEQTVTVTTSQISLSLGSIVSLGWVVVENHDATNYITVGCVTGQRPNRVPPGAMIMFYADANAIFAAANTASCLATFTFYSQ